MNNIKGQSMLELVIALGLLSVVVTILAAATVGGLKNSQFSKNQSQATKLAEEAIEKVRTIKERNSNVCGPGSTTNWQGLYSIDPAVSCSPVSADCNFSLKTSSDPLPGGCTATVPASADWLNNDLTGTVKDQIKVDSTLFERQIRIKNSGSVKEVTVLVFWTDISGTHNSKLVTVLANY